MLCSNNHQRTKTLPGLIWYDHDLHNYNYDDESKKLFIPLIVKTWRSLSKLKIGCLYLARGEKLNIFLLCLPLSRKHSIDWNRRPSYKSTDEGKCSDWSVDAFIDWDICFIFTQSFNPWMASLLIPLRLIPMSLLFPCLVTVCTLSQSDLIIPFPELLCFCRTEIIINSS